MTDVLEVLKKLPPVAYVDNYDKSPGVAPVLAVKRGVLGYFPIFSKLKAADLNKAAGVTARQALATYTGSMFGFDSPGADPDYYTEDEAAKRFGGAA